MNGRSRMDKYQSLRQEVANSTDTTDESLDVRKDNSSGYDGYHSFGSFGSSRGNASDDTANLTTSFSRNLTTDYDEMLKEQEEFLKSLEEQFDSFRNTGSFSTVSDNTSEEILPESIEALLNEETVPDVSIDDIEPETVTEEPVAEPVSDIVEPVTEEPVIEETEVFIEPETEPEIEQPAIEPIIIEEVSLDEVSDRTEQNDLGDIELVSFALPEVREEEPQPEDVPFDFDNPQAFAEEERKDEFSEILDNLTVDDVIDNTYMSLDMPWVNKNTNEPFEFFREEEPEEEIEEEVKPAFELPKVSSVFGPTDGMVHTGYYDPQHDLYSYNTFLSSQKEEKAEDPTEEHAEKEVTVVTNDAEEQMYHEELEEYADILPHISAEYTPTEYVEEEPQTEPAEAYEAEPAEEQVSEEELVPVVEETIQTFKPEVVEEKVSQDEMNRYADFVKPEEEPVILNLFAPRAIEEPEQSAEPVSEEVAEETEKSVPDNDNEIQLADVDAFTDTDISQILDDYAFDFTRDEDTIIPERSEFTDTFSGILSSTFLGLDKPDTNKEPDLEEILANEKIYDDYYDDIIDQSNEDYHEDTELESSEYEELTLPLDDEPETTRFAEEPAEEETVQPECDEIQLNLDETAEQLSESEEDPVEFTEESVEEQVEIEQQDSEESMQQEEELVNTVDNQQLEIADEGTSKEVDQRDEDREMIDYDDQINNAEETPEEYEVSFDDIFVADIDSPIDEYYGEEETAVEEPVVYEETQIEEPVTEAAEESVEEAADSVEEFAENAQVAVEETVEEFTEPVEEAVEETIETAEEFAENAEETVEEAVEEFADTTEEFVEQADAAVDEFTETAQEAVDEFAEPVEEAVETVEEFAEDAEEKVDEFTDTVAETFDDVAEAVEDEVGEVTEKFVIPNIDVVPIDMGIAPAAVEQPFGNVELVSMPWEEPQPVEETAEPEQEEEQSLVFAIEEPDFELNAPVVNSSLTSFGFDEPMVSVDLDALNRSNEPEILEVTTEEPEAPSIEVPEVEITEPSFDFTVPETETVEFDFNQSDVEENYETEEREDEHPEVEETFEPIDLTYTEQTFEQPEAETEPQSEEQVTAETEPAEEVKEEWNPTDFTYIEPAEEKSELDLPFEKNDEVKKYNADDVGMNIRPFNIERPEEPALERTEFTFSSAEEDKPEVPEFDFSVDDELDEMSDIFTSEPLEDDYNDIDKILSDVKNYNIEQGIRNDENTQINIISQLKKDAAIKEEQEAAEKPAVEEPAKKGLFAGFFNVNDNDEDGYEEEEPHKEDEVKVELKEPEAEFETVLDDTDDISVEETNESISNTLANMKPFKDEFTLEDDDYYELDNTPVITSEKEPEYQPQPQPVYEQNKEHLNELTQKIELERELRQEMFEQTQQLKLQVSEYENELNDVNNNMSRTNRILNVVLTLLIVALFVIIVVIGFFFAQERGLI